MRRIGASGSEADVLGRCRIPLARSVEPSDGSGDNSTAGSMEIGGAGSAKGLGVEGHEGGSAVGCCGGVGSATGSGALATTIGSTGGGGGGGGAVVSASDT